MRTALIIFLLALLAGCSLRKPFKTLRVKYVVTYSNNIMETVEASPYAVLKETGCLVDRGNVVVRCYVRSIQRVPIKEYGSDY